MTVPEELINAAEILRSQLNRGYINPRDVETLNRILTSSNPSPNYLESIISLIDGTIRSPDYYNLDPDLLLISVYETILSKLPISSILQLYPISLITETLEYGNQFSLLILKIVTLNHEKMDVVDTGILETTLRLYFSDPDLPISICSQIQTLLECLTANEKSQLNQPEFTQLFQMARLADSTILSRLLDLINVLVPYVDFDLSFNLDLGDVLLSLLIINFYEKLVKKRDQKVFDIITPMLNKIFDLFRSDDPDVEAFLLTDIINLMATVSYCFPQFQLPVLTVDDTHMLSKINPEQIDDELVSRLIELPLFQSKYFGILLNIIKVQTLFTALIDHDKLSSQSVTNLSSDMLYMFLVELTSTDHGVKYLLNDLPSVVSDYIIPHQTVNGEIYSAKLTVLENLVLKNYDLLVWEDQLIDTYKEMKNGKNIRHQITVDVADETIN